MNIKPYDELGYAIVEQAAEDVKSLEAAGIIVGGKCIKPWPVHSGNPLKVMGHYDKRHKVVELLHWFTRGGAEELLETLGSSLSIDTVLKGLHIG